MTGVAVVTGASRGIGRLLAEALEGAGWGVERGSSAVADVTDAASVRRWVDDVLARHERIDLLVNNAGVVDAEVPLEESDPDDWWRSIEVNVRGPYLMTRAVLPIMLEQGSGRIVNLNSGSGTKPGEVASAYNVGKSALGRITGSTHQSGRRHGVLAFDFAPGVVRTDMTRSMPRHDDRTEWTDPAEVVELFLALTDGRLDAWSGRMVRAGDDTVEALLAATPTLAPGHRTVGLVPYGEDDPLR
ncbi:SDR family oxidoreductase [Janibacter cremeus]|uniref:NAD(P)-dependent dehydrogenase (Short-subunit alcohol dehydrogenase family) n=1 Tax=Janibacter cremeus TaxID=1285192 RepID=A0A852W0J4_9MICO|nr:SDR family oxidoreductase [Janibacter cremeus]NYF99505.1 NAD(P)-dependent dehydrogenase (short-subunit alcohol dehydrogenase family) [Janibacter cremeus]